MTMDTETIVVAPAAAGTEEHHSYVDWAAVIGGIVLASALSLLMLTFGAAVGLSFVTFRSFAGTARTNWIAWKPG